MAKRNVKCKVEHSNYPIVEVIWVDAEEVGDIGWNDKKEILREAKKPCPTMHTVGYCLYRGDDHISIVNTLGDSECSRLDKIPMAFVKAVNILRNEA